MRVFIVLKKFIFISIACCLFFKPIQVFSADYDEDDTEIMMNGENPFADTRFCGFEKFKQWFSLKEKQQSKIDEKNEKNFKNALAFYLNYKFKNEQTFDEALKLSVEGAQNACPKSMELLGTLKVEKGDNAPDAEKKKYYNDAFSWYVISFWMHIIKEVKLKKNVVIPSKIISNLENLTKKSGFCQKRINYFNYLNKNKEFVLDLLKYSDKQTFYKYIVRIVHNMYANYMQDCFFVDRKFFVFTFNILDWALSLKNGLMDNKKNVKDLFNV